MSQRIYRPIDFYPWSFFAHATIYGILSWCFASFEGLVIVIFDGHSNISKNRLFSSGGWGSQAKNGQIQTQFQTKVSREQMVAMITSHILFANPLTLIQRL